MVKNMIVFIVCGLFVGLLLCGTLSTADAQESEQTAEMKESDEQAADESSTEIPDPSTLGPWWFQSALKYEPMYPNWLFHAQVEFSYNKKGGNTQGDDYSSSASLALRKNRFTSYVDYTLSKNETTIAVGGATTKVEEQLFVFREQIDLLRWMALGFGVTWDRNSSRFLLNRYNTFGGLHFTIFDRPKFMLNAGLYYGYVDTEYDNKGLASVGLPTAEDLDSGGTLFRQFARYSLTENVTILEIFNYMKLFDDDDSYRWQFTPILSIALSNHFSVFVNYDIREEQTPIYDALKVAGAEKQDTSLMMGFGIEF